jgi:hypothetical protein
MPTDDPANEMGARVTTDTLWQVIAAATGAAAIGACCEEDPAARPWPAGTGTAERATAFVHKNSAHLTCITAILLLPTAAALAIDVTDDDAVEQLLKNMEAVLFNQSAHATLGSVKLTDSLRQQRAKKARGACMDNSQDSNAGEHARSTEAGWPHHRNAMASDNMIMAIITYSQEHTTTYLYSIQELAKQKRVSAVAMLEAIGSTVTVLL